VGGACAFLLSCIVCGLDGEGGERIRAGDICMRRTRAYGSIGMRARRASWDAGNAAVWVWGRDVCSHAQACFPRADGAVSATRAPRAPFPIPPSPSFLQYVLIPNNTLTPAYTDPRSPLHCLRAVHEALDLDSSTSGSGSATDCEGEGRGLAALGRLFGGRCGEGCLALFPLLLRRITGRMGKKARCWRYSG
jgi:hypothetical protein